MPVRAGPCNTYVDVLVSVGPLSIYHQRKYYTNTTKNTRQVLYKYYKVLKITISYTYNSKSHYKLYKYRDSRQRIKATWNSQSKTFLHTAVPVQAMNLKRSITFETNNDKSYD